MNILEILGSVIIVIGGVWGFFKLFFRYRSKFLFITNCQILHKKIWEDIGNYYPKLIDQDRLMDHAFRPLVLLPHSLKEYTSIKNGQKAVLESINGSNESKLKIIAEVYWIPEEMNKWNKINHPVFSLILRRYFGIEMPVYQDEKEEELKKKLADWELVKHHKEHLDPLNKSLDENHLQWLMRKQYTFRYFNPDIGDKGEYESEPNKNNFIEYCGLSIIFRSHSIIHIEKD